MQATAASRIVNTIGIINKKIVKFKDTLIRKFPRRDIKRCPAIRFAVNRTHNVIGRIRFLVSSIITIKDISMAGVPWGSRCESM